MTPQMQAIFEPLRRNLESRQMTDVDLFQIIGDFAESSGFIARAFSFHARDILQEKDQQGQEIEYGQVIAEVYRRAFFDEATANLYGTGQMLERGPEFLQQFVEHLVVMHGMDKAQEAAGSFIEGTDSRH